MIEEIVHVSANLRHDGGGAAHFGRLCGWALRRYCGRRRLRFRGLHMPASDDAVALDGYESFDGSKWRLGLAIAGCQRAGRHVALFFDHPGPARAQARVPASWRAPHAVAVLGIDVWRELGDDARAALATARPVVAISATTAREAVPFLPPGCDVRVVHPGIEPRRGGGALDEALVAEVGTGYVLLVGRMAGAERYKGHEELLAAAALAASACPGLRLVFAGDGADRVRLEAVARGSGLAERMRFCGEVSDATLRELYRRCALFAMPSRREGFGLVFVEAMAEAKPCLALAGTAPAEIVVDGETGRLVEPTPAAIAAALVELLCDPVAARRMGEAGRRRYEVLFTAESFESRFEPVLDALVGG